MLSGLNENELRRILQTQTRRHYHRGALIYHENDPTPRHISIIERGRVRSYIASQNGKEFTHRINAPGSILGLFSFFAASPVFMSMECLDDVDVYQISSENLMMLMEDIPRLSLNVTRTISKLYIESVSRSSQAFKPATIRLGRLLSGLLTSHPNDAPSGSGDVRGLTQQHLTTLAGISRTWVAITLAQFEADGMIRRSRGLIKVPDKAAFAAYITQLEAQIG
ncbi:Crp/Fnr family transcriptional regulator [Xanthobacter dioxanivorans]|uniref:Crp/Fnr family transcriptional regulator n=1 Tax=Xanthobacter dioxanivorans TaxID=2528964 RepID=A0A974PSX8_9HYPH|nr:Crp/Fnr family transcriptional regulator [Xanthobacter dioxanivorans]QRG08673.1 Crp/Fnr family transcriptional regulator [Xanthobacter dioxanivorans]